MLPDKISDLIELGVKDLLACMDRGVEPDMNVWVERIDDICYACLAGGIMLNSLGVTPKPLLCIVNVSTNDDPEILIKFQKLDDVVKGELTDAIWPLKEVTESSPWSPDLQLAVEKIQQKYGSLPQFPTREEILNLLPLAQELRDLGL